MNVHSPQSLALKPRAGFANKTTPFFARAGFQLFGGLLACVLVPCLIRAGIGYPAAPDAPLVHAGLGAMAALTVGFYYLRKIEMFPGVRSGSHILLGITLPFASVIAVFFAARFGYSRFLFAVSYFLSLAWFFGLHMMARRRVKPRLVIVPGGNAASLSNHPDANWKLLPRPPSVLGDVAGVVADLRSDLPLEWERFIATCTLNGVPVFHSKQIKESLTGKVEIEHLSENNFGSLLPSLFYLKIKQVGDWLVALAVFPLFLVIALPVGLLILLESGRPVFFRQPRVGYRGNQFNVYKFRTMRQGSDGAVPAESEAIDLAMTRENDPRITRVGRFLRKFRIDEIPQIINILKGEMSWIGPRPEAMQLAEWYEDQLPFYCYRHVVRPGISGWAQVNQGHVSAPEKVLEKLHYDFFYIKYVSPWLDLLIFMKTLRILWTGFGAK